MEVLTPIETVELFPAIHAELIDLLRALDEEDWARPTLARSWRVRDVVAHLLDGDLRKLAGGRDRHQITLRIAASFTDIVDLINELNAGGVYRMYRRSRLQSIGTWKTPPMTTASKLSRVLVAVS